MFSEEIILELKPKSPFEPESIMIFFEFMLLVRKDFLVTFSFEINKRYESIVINNIRRVTDNDIMNLIFKS